MTLVAHGSDYNLGPNTTLQFAVNPQISVENDEATEGTDTNLIFKVTLLPPALETTTADYGTQGASATGGGVDFTDTNGTLTWTAGQSIKYVRVPIIDDSVSDGGEEMLLQLTNASGVTRFVDSNGDFQAAGLGAIGTINNDEPSDDLIGDLPLVSIEADAEFETEGSNASFTLSRTGEASDALTVSLTVAEDGAMLIESTPTSASFDAGSATATIEVNTVGDDTDEADSKITVTLATGDGYKLGTNNQSQATTTILDDDAATLPGDTVAVPGTVIWTADMTVVDYGNGNIGAGSASLLASQSGSEDLRARWLYYESGERKLRMAFTTGINTAALRLKGAHLNMPFPAGRSGDASFTWENIDVDWSDGDTFDVELVRGEVAATAAPDPTLKALSVSGATLSPAFDPETVLYTAVMDSNTESVTVSATTNDDDATVAFGPSEDADSKAANHQVTAGEGDTLTTVTVTAPDGETTRTYRVIVKRGRTVAVSFDAATYTATESNSAAAVMVSLNANPTHAITIPLTTTPGGGATAADYSAPGSVTFTSGGALSQTVTVTAVGDDTAESGETVTIGFGTLPAWVEAGSRTNTTVTLTDAPATNTAPGGAPQITGTTEIGSTLTAAVNAITDADGVDNATFEYQWIANNGTSDADIDGATTNTYTLVAADAGKTIKVRVTFTDDAGTRETLASAATTTITSASLTASFANMPSEHGGGGEANRFTFDLSFSENLALSYRKLRDHHAFTVDGGQVKKAQRKVRGSSQHWTITVEPGGWGDVSLTLPGGRACTASNSICTSDNRQLSNSPSATVRGPASLSVADATANENTDDALEFPVTLDRASTLTVTVDYATSDGTATAGADYTATSGTLTFSPGETTKAVSVPVLDDAVDDPGETMTLTLSNAVNAQIADATATGTINNSDQLQKAWIARFGRTVAAQVIDGIGERLATPQNGSHVQIAGVRLERNGATWTETPADDDAAVDNTLEREHTLSGQQLLLQSAFRLQGEADASGERAWTAWGRISRASFEGEDEDVKLSGDVTTGLLGADIGTDDWIAGLALSIAKGDGPFTLTSDRSSNRDKGTVESSLTSVHPYAQVNATDRLALWAIGGYGTGDMTIAEEGGTPMKTDIDMTMAAIGARGQVLDTGTGDALDMAVRTDALWLRATSDATRKMAGAEADVTRLRLMIDTSRGFTVGAGTLTPSIEAGRAPRRRRRRGRRRVRNRAGLAYQGTGITHRGQGAHARRPRRRRLP